MILSIVSSALISTSVTITFIMTFIWKDIRRLERRYQEKDRLLDDQLASANRMIDKLDQTQRQMYKLPASKPSIKR